MFFFIQVFKLKIYADLRNNNVLQIQNTLKGGVNCRYCK